MGIVLPGAALAGSRAPGATGVLAALMMRGDVAPAFAPADSPAAPPPPPAGTAPLANPATMLALLTIAPDHARRRMLRRLANGLDLLDRLMAADDPAPLVPALTAWVEGAHADAGEPALDALHAEMAVRVAVELAKLDQRI